MLGSHPVRKRGADKGFGANAGRAAQGGGSRQLPGRYRRQHELDPTEADVADNCKRYHDAIGDPLRF